MNEHRPIYKKGSLLYATIVALACVMTAGVSTFAWFQAEANVRVSTANSSTNITVSAPDTFTLGAATIYAYNNNGPSGYIGDATGDISGETPVNFTELSTNELKATYLSINGLAPGRKMSFGIKVTTSGGNASSASLTLTSYTTTNNNYRKVLSAVTDGSTGTLATYPGDAPVQKIIRIEDVVKFYGAVNNTGVFSLGSSSALDDYDVSYTGGTGSQSKTYSDQEYEIAAGGSLAASTFYVFYTIEFSNAPETLYQEYKLQDSNYHRCYEVVANNYAGERFFYADPDHPEYGNSSCYEGLSFVMNELHIDAL